MATANAYTQRFVSRDGPAGMNSYDVPAGYRAVITSVVGWGQAATASGFNLWVAGLVMYLWSAPGAYAATTLQMRLVAYAGERISIETLGTRASATASGYLFRDDEGPKGASIEDQPPPPRDFVMPGDPGWSGA